MQLCTVSNISQPLEHVFVAAVKGIFRSFQYLNLDACTWIFPAHPTGALHSPKRGHHLSLSSPLAVLLWGCRTSKEIRGEGHLKWQWCKYKGLSLKKVFFLNFNTTREHNFHVFKKKNQSSMGWRVLGREVGWRQQYARAGHQSCSSLWMRTLWCRQRSFLRALYRQEQTQLGSCLST